MSPYFAVTEVPMAQEERVTSWLSTLASLMVGAAFLALWFWLLPAWLGFRVSESDSPAIQGE